MKRFFALLALFGLLLSVQPAWASLQSEVFSFSYDTGLQKKISPYDIPISQFNPSLGTLASVSISFQDTFSYSVQFTNRDDTPSTFTYTPSFTMTSSAGGTSWTQSYSGTPLTRVLQAGATGTITGSEALPLLSAGTFASLAPFIGTSSFLLNMKPTISWSTQTDASEFNSKALSGISTTGTVTYSYTATPIPGAIWLLGSGLAGMVALRRRSLK